MGPVQYKEMGIRQMRLSCPACSYATLLTYVALSPMALLAAASWAAAGLPIQTPPGLQRPYSL